jgi:mRNA-degrading endonuclease toxin of MazEF toxin-antitoxin module
VVVVSHDAFNEIDTWRSVIVVPLTTSARQGARGPTVVPLPQEQTSLPQESFALCHQVTTLDRAKLEPPIGRLGKDSLRQLGRGVVVACDLHTAVERA